MLSEKLKNYNIILASKSPRRQRFFKEMDIDFSIQLKETEEKYPDTLSGVQITDYLAKLKAAAFEDLAVISPVVETVFPAPDSANIKTNPIASRN